jgi:hypothetical protein
LPRYIVTGTLPQFGHGPGEEFETDLPAALEERAITRGGIAIAQDGDGLDDLTRAELNERAAEAGVESPESLPNKGAVIGAIREALDENPDPASGDDTP